MIYGTAGGLSTVAFILCVNTGFQVVWSWITQAGTLWFLGTSLIVIVVSSLLAGMLVSWFSPEAAGSGIPQLKVAYWKDLGDVPMRAVLVKFIGGSIALIGGASLGREGPTVFFAGGLSSKIAGWLGIPQQRRRHAAASGAAAGLSAAFNTPLAAIAFVLEEILGDMNNRLLGSVVLAAVAGAFVIYWFLGSQPSFYMPAVNSPTWNMYLFVPFAAALGSLFGVLFQRGTLDVRMKTRQWKRIPAWTRPLFGGLVTWFIGCLVYLAVHRYDAALGIGNGTASDPMRGLGVFGLGYGDLSVALKDGIGWKIAGILAVTKLVATIYSYGTGGCGGIFSPTLFIGAMCGFFVAGLAQHSVHLSESDVLVLAATGMSACLGAVVRAPFTGILIIFEMTHQFGMVPALMLGTLVSQFMARLAGKVNFYEAILEQDGHEIHRIVPPRDLSAWRNIPVSAIAGTKPVPITSLAPDALKAALAKHAYRCFPVIIDGVLRGVVTRADIEHALALGHEPAMEAPVVCRADQSLQDVEPLMIESAAGLFLVVETAGGAVTGVFTLHDLLRVQAALLE
ncbi:MAG: chloride channel protein [Burkholderiales bacterium]|nr:chloride channel protein [Burkholderiales bacterium]MDE1928150.1 chloride channel protein [Burkholderiales bacterium]MDE2158362.1 chloride channel protein [Burkholderiales bacterium]MDE2502362.1 chloride channel protein [Burkholderiales bacterium]